MWANEPHADLARFLGCKRVEANKELSVHHDNTARREKQQ
jgi:hypothetical protein